MLRIDGRTYTLSTFNGTRVTRTSMQFAKYMWDKTHGWSKFHEFIREESVPENQA